MMVGHLKHEGTSHSSSDLLKIFVKMGASWSAQVLRQAGDNLACVIFTYFQCRCGGGGGGGCWRC